jgi:TetR/AcrR family transcriptional regulator
MSLGSSPHKAVKRVRDPGKTRAALLQAGIRLFCLRGYTGVSVDTIVVKANCNKRMLYHYFGNKEGLYVAVLKSVFAKLETIEVGMLHGKEGLGEVLEGLLESYFDFLEKNPEFVRLLMWENLNEGRFLAKHPDLLLKNPVMDELKAVLRQGSQGSQGNFKELDSRHLLIQLYAISFIYHSNQSTFTHTLGLDLHDKKVRRAGVRQATELLLRGLLNRD